MRESVERELKLAPGAGFSLPELGGRPLPSRIFVSTYHDTPDLRLARDGVTFRHRVEDGAGLWQLKLPRGAARIELEHAGPPARPPAEMLELLAAYLRGRELVPVARLRTRREGVRAQGADVVEDSVAVLEHQRVTRRFREIEVELLDGDERTLRRLEKALRRAGAEPGSFTPKLYRALDLAYPPEPDVLEPGAPVRDELAAAFREQYRRILAHDPGTRLGTDIEDLHQLRVATRRMRAFLRAARPVVDPAWDEGLRAELGWLGSALGPARDLDVLLEYLEPEVEALQEDAEPARGLLESIRSERAAARAAVVDALSSDRYLQLLDRLEEAGQEPHLVRDDVTLVQIWWNEFRRTRRAIAKLGDDPADDALHAARIRVKRARYAAELAANELGARGSAFVTAAKDMQDVLGEHQDAVVAEERVRAWLGTSPWATFAGGRLVERQRARRAAARASWRTSWARLERAGRKVKR
jgi:CHAD domain-containing protein